MSITGISSGDGTKDVAIVVGLSGGMPARRDRPTPRPRGVLALFWDDFSAFCRITGVLHRKYKKCPYWSFLQFRRAGFGPKIKSLGRRNP